MDATASALVRCTVTGSEGEGMTDQEEPYPPHSFLLRKDADFGLLVGQDLLEVSTLNLS
jgi:hypothetical protein